MRLLIVTQAVDADDPVLGFFCRWVEEFAKHVERIEVICLKEGKHELPVNVRVHSLGKTENSKQTLANRIRYVFRFLKLAWRLRHDYDSVFVHMNQEYVLINGWLWKLLGKRIFMWRNHYKGSYLTDIAALFCTKIFCTSKHSYTAKYKKSELMPVGVDTERFFPDACVKRKSRSILFLARMASSKRPDMLIDALAMLASGDIEFTATFVGSPMPADAEYYGSLKEKVRTLDLADRVTFHPGIPNGQTPDLYRAHEIFVNTSPSGMLDKTIFEAAACGCHVLAASADFAALAGPDTHFSNALELAIRLTSTLAAGAPTSAEPFVQSNSLAALGKALQRAIYSGPAV